MPKPKKRPKKPPAPAEPPPTAPKPAHELTSHEAADHLFGEEAVKHLKRIAGTAEPEPENSSSEPSNKRTP